MTPGFTNENQAYKRTVYLLDKPQSHIDIYFFFTNKYTQLAKMSIDPKFVKLTADVLKIFL